MQHQRMRGAALGAAVIAVTTLLAACGDGGGGGGTDPADLGDVGAMEDYDVGTTFVASEPVTFSLLYRDHPNYPLNEDWLVLQELADSHNVSFDIVSAPLSDYENRRSLLIGAGDAPEIISVTSSGQEVPFVAGGALLPVSEYLDYLPNFTAKVEAWGLQAQLDQMRQEDGNFYLLPGLREQVRPQYTYAVRSDIWDELGLSYEPATFEEFADQLRAVKEAYPDLWPMSDRWFDRGTMLNTVAPNFGTLAGNGFGQGAWWDENAGEYVFAGATEGYRQLVEFYAGLVSDGLMDPETITQDDDQAVQKFSSGESIVIGANDQEILRYRAAFDELGSDAEVRLIRLPGGPAGDNLAANGRTESGFMISAAAAESDHFLALLQFVDWLYYSDEGLEFAKWGVEGQTFEREGDVRVLEDDIDVNGLNPGAPQQLSVDYGFHNGVWMLSHGSTSDLDQSMLRPEVIDFVDAMSTKTELSAGPPWPLTELEREQVSLWQSALRDHVDQNTALFILGQRPLEEWDAYVAELEGMNMLAYLDVVNEAQQRFAEDNPS